jgi:hypothetical protein
MTVIHRYYRPAPLLAAALACALPLGSSGVLASGGEGDETDTASGPARSVDVAYDIYAGGVTLGKVDMSARIQGGDYKVVTSLETTGVVNRFWQSSIQTSSTGAFASNRIQPSEYDSTSTHSDKSKVQKVAIKFGPDGKSVVESNPPYSKKDIPITEDNKKGALDPSSAVLSVATGMSATAANPCGNGTRVYDGRRRYDVDFSFVKNVDVKLDNGIYAGPALLCEIKYVEVEGYKQEVLRQGSKLPQMFAWMVSTPSKTDPSQHYVIPVRLWANTDFGVVAAVASKVRLDGGPLAADRRADLASSGTKGEAKARE